MSKILSVQPTEDLRKKVYQLIREHGEGFSDDASPAEYEESITCVTLAIVSAVSFERDRIVAICEEAMKMADNSGYGWLEGLKEDIQKGRCPNGFPE